MNFIATVRRFLIAYQPPESVLGIQELMKIWLKDKYIEPLQKEQKQIQRKLESIPENPQNIRQKKVLEQLTEQNQKIDTFLPQYEELYHSDIFDKIANNIANGMSEHWKPVLEREDVTQLMAENLWRLTTGQTESGRDYFAAPALEPLKATKETLVKLVATALKNTVRRQLLKPDLILKHEKRLPEETEEDRPFEESMGQAPSIHDPLPLEKSEIVELKKNLRKYVLARDPSKHTAVMLDTWLQSIEHGETPRTIKEDMYKAVKKKFGETHPETFRLWYKKLVELIVSYFEDVRDMRITDEMKRKLHLEASEKLSSIQRYIASYIIAGIKLDNGFEIPENMAKKLKKKKANVNLAEELLAIAKLLI